LRPTPMTMAMPLIAIGNFVKSYVARKSAVNLSTRHGSVAKKSIT